MTYASGNLIQASDYNTFSTDVNAFWGTGSGNSGYGQTAIGTVTATTAPAGLVRAAEWAQLFNAISSAAAHQPTGITGVTTPVAGDTITAYAPTVANNITSVTSNRLNAAASGATSATVATNSATWTQILTFTFTVAFSSNDSARYFFNAGGQLGLSFTHPDGTTGINEIIQDISNEFGTMWLSSPTSGAVTIAGTSYNGITKIGGLASSRGVANTNNGFYALTSTDSQCYQQTSDVVYGYYGTTFLRIFAAYNGSGTITFTCVFDETPDGLTVSVGTAGTLTVRPPSTTYLTNSWGTPTVSSSITRT